MHPLMTLQRWPLFYKTFPNNLEYMYIHCIHVTEFNGEHKFQIFKLTHLSNK